jgi:transcriptional regulator with XRE-family HTH domain
MGYVEEHAQAEWALSQERVDRSSTFPPAAAHLKAAREARGFSQRDLVARFGAERHLCPDLELHEDELFTCISVADLLHLAAVLHTSAAALLFGEGPSQAVPTTTFSDVAESVRAAVLSSGKTPDDWGELVGWDIAPLLKDAQNLGDFNIQGLRDVCKGIGLDWVAVLNEQGS